MFNDDSVKSTLIKAAAMLVLVAAQWWAMQPYHEPMLAKLWQMLAQFCYKTARKFGQLGLAFEFNYYQAV